MTFKEWREKAEALKKKADPAIAQAVEVMSVDGKDVVITLGRNASVTVDGRDGDFRGLRPFWTKNKVEFLSTLESLEEQVNTIIEASDIILTAATEDGVTSAVMERLKGGDEKTPVQMLKESATRKLGELAESVKLPEGSVDSLDVSLRESDDGDVPDVQFSVNSFGSGAAVTIGYGVFSVEYDGSTYKHQTNANQEDTEAYLRLAGDLPKIKEKINKIVELLKEINKIKL